MKHTQINQLLFPCFLVFLLLFCASCDSINQKKRAAKAETLRLAKEQMALEEIREDCKKYPNDPPHYCFPESKDLVTIYHLPKPKKKAKPKVRKRKPVPDNELTKAAKKFLNALSRNSIAEAAKHSDKYGLGTLLYLDVKNIHSYELRSQEIMSKAGFVNVRLNGGKRNVPLFFKYENKKWIFKGLDLGKYLNVSNVDLYMREKLDYEELGGR